MNEEQIKLAANSIAGLSEASGETVRDILDALSGVIIDEEDCSAIIQYITTV